MLGAAFVFARDEEMTEEAASDEEDNARCSTEGRVHWPEVRRGHLFEEARIQAGKSYFAGEIK